MMKLEAYFVRDWLDLLADILQSHWGYDISGVSPDELSYLYFNAEQRRPDQRPRKVEVADSFSCPPELQAGWDRLRSLVESGLDITAHLSKLISLLQNKDSMLNDFGVHHFHLGDAMNGPFVERTGPLLFALVTKQVFYAIGIFRHGSWADSSVVETIHRNWPEVIARFQIKNCESTNKTTETQRLALRAKNYNSLSTVSDGTVYMPIGGGAVAAGYNALSIVKTDRQIELLKNLEKHLEERLPQLREELIKHGYNDSETVVEARLEITPDRYLAIFPKYNVSVTLMTEGWRESPIRVPGGHQITNRATYRTGLSF